MKAGNFSHADGSGLRRAPGAATVSAEPEHWSEFLASMREERARHDSARPLRALAEEFAMVALALMFPQFAHPQRPGPSGVAQEAARLVALLEEALDPLVPQAARCAASVLERLPIVREMLMQDATAILNADPAATDFDEVIIAYPGFLAIAIHRLAHEMYLRRVPLFPRVLSEWAHRETGIDIHPGATIGLSFAIDHGTGVVIGETSQIGDRVRIYQGVTLGAHAVSKKLQNSKRHPTIGNDVVIYANATILGGSTEVGDGSVIGGNVWLTTSVPAGSVVQFVSTVEPGTAPASKKSSGSE